VGKHPNHRFFTQIVMQHSPPAGVNIQSDVNMKLKQTDLEIGDFVKQNDCLLDRTAGNQANFSQHEILDLMSSKIMSYQFAYLKGVAR